MNSSGVKAVPAQRRWRKLCMCAAALSLGVHGYAVPHKPGSRSKSQAVDFFRPEPGHLPQDLLLKEEDARKAKALASFSQGILAEENADPDEALAAFRRTLDFDPGFNELAAKVAVELVRRKSYDQAVNVLKDAIKVSSTDPSIYLLISQIYGKYLKKTESAIRYANQALELDPTNVLAFLTLFEAQVNQPKKAEQLLERAAKLDNHDPQFWLQLAEIYSRAILQGASRSGASARSGAAISSAQSSPVSSPAVVGGSSPVGSEENPDDSAKNSAPAKSDGAAPKKEELEKVNAVYQKALGFADKQPEIVLKVAEYYTASRQYKAAIPLYEQLISQLLEGTPDAMLPEVQERLARCYRIAGQTQQAIASLKEMIKQNPLRYESYELLAGIYEEEGDLQNALANYQQTLLMNSSQPVNYLRVADMLLKLRDRTKPGSDKGPSGSDPVEVLKEARAKFPEIPQITFSLAIALAQAGRPQEALASFSECLADAKSSQPDMLNGAFYLAYGSAAEQAGNLEQAEVMLKRSIEVDPDNSAQACNYLGYMWIDRGLRLDEAGKLIERALEILPGNGAFLDSLGWFYFKKGDYPKALDQLKRAAAAIKPEDAVVFEHLGDVWFNLGNVAEALANWRKALGLEKANPVQAAGGSAGAGGSAKRSLQQKIDEASRPAPAATGDKLFAPEPVTAK